MIGTILLLLALVCFLLAAFGVGSRVALMPLGLAFYMLDLLLPGLGTLH